MPIQKIRPFLWFDNQAEEAANFYCQIFPNSRVLSKTHYADGAPQPGGTVMTVSFELDGLPLIALNGGPHFHFTEAVSFLISAETQDEIDELWSKLCDGGEPGRCGWLKDKFGLSWQVAPPLLNGLLASDDKVRSGRAMQALLGMNKIVIADLQKAYDGE